MTTTTETITVTVSTISDRINVLAAIEDLRENGLNPVEVTTTTNVEMESNDE